MDPKGRSSHDQTREFAPAVAPLSVPNVQLDAGEWGPTYHHQPRKSWWISSNNLENLALG